MDTAALVSVWNEIESDECKCYRGYSSLRDINLKFILFKKKKNKKKKKKKKKWRWLKHRYLIIKWVSKKAKVLFKIINILRTT
jgi:hypothetical protein